jgi:hypothetical protein
MLGRILAAPAPQGLTLAKSSAALAVALGVGATSMAFPQAALLLLALLAARALMGANTARLNLAALAGPALAALLVGAFVGLAGAIGVLFIWRLIADTRWSVREARRLSEAAGRPDASTRRALLHAWATPLFGLTLVAFTAPHMVAGLPLDLPHAPLWSVIMAGAVAALVVFDWALKCAADWRLGELATAPAAHLLSHHALFVLAFGLTLDVSAGIVAMIAWRLAHAAPARQASLTAVP